MLESEIKKLTAAVEANTAARLGGTIANVSAAPVSMPLAAPAAATLAATNAPEAALSATPTAATAPAETVTAAPADLKMITEGIVALARAKGREAAAALLAEYGAARVPDLKKVSDKYDEIFAKITALIDAK